LLPLTLAPGWLRGLAHTHPLYYTVEAARLLWTVGEGFLVTAGLTALTLVWATGKYREAAR
jgi:ABC-2 type transport system permease protein